MASLNSVITCSTCFRKITIDKSGISCVACGRWFHANNVGVKSPLTCQQTETDLCNILLSDALPFTSIDELDFNFTFGDFTRLPSAEDMDKLMRLKFNPFDDKQSSTDFSNSQILDNFNNITCKYYLPKDISLEINNNKNFSILNFNIRSIVNKFDSFKFFLESFKNAFSVISVTETWLNNQNCEDFNLNNYSFITTNRGERKGGGVEMFISDDINFKLRSDLNINEEGIIESLFIEIITATRKNIIVGTIYRPPNGKFDIFENNLSKILTKIDK